MYFHPFLLNICNFEIREAILDFKLAFEIIEFEGFVLKMMRNSALMNDIQKTLTMFF